MIARKQYDFGMANLMVLLTATQTSLDIKNGVDDAEKEFIETE